MVLKRLGTAALTDCVAHFKIVNFMVIELYLKKKKRKCYQRPGRVYKRSNERSGKEEKTKDMS